MVVSWLRTPSPHPSLVVAGHWFRQRLKGSFKGAMGDGWTSAKTFATMGGIYATVSCLMKRIRQTDDGKWG